MSIPASIRFVTDTFIPLGRWPNRDPIGEGGFEVKRGGFATVWGDGPNRYGFANNDPVKGFDPEGLNVIKNIGKGLAGPGDICTGAVCDKNKVNAKVRIVPEEDWHKNDVNSWKAPPAPRTTFWEK